MTVSKLKIGRREYVLVSRKDFEQLRRKADLLSDEDAADVAECIKRLNDPREKRIPWDKVKHLAGLV
jgi:PHD/YefM family antitoxin component YafN of YafNO toxin-antitoxin module